MHTGSFEAPERPPLGPVEVAYGILFEPVNTFKALTSAPPPLGLVLATVLGAPVVVALAAGGSLAPAIAGAAWYLLWWLVSTAVLALAAELFGGQGRARDLLLLLGLTRLPALLAAPLQLLAPASPALAVLGQVAVALWALVLAGLAVRENYGLSTGQAVAALVVPVAAVVLLALVAGVAAAVYLAGELAGF